jgi:hypothetical protein
MCTVDASRIVAVTVIECRPAGIPDDEIAAGPVRSIDELYWILCCTADSAPDFAVR